MTAFPSLRDKNPTEEGGPIAKQGNSYEKQVTMHYCLQMLTSGTLKEVWCDLHDDVVLVYDDSSEDVFEFVQIKNENHDQLWTLSLLCEKKKDKKSIYEKSLAHDSCAEKVRFRLVTSLPCKSELSIFSYELDSTQRSQYAQKIRQIAFEINKKSKNFVSPKGNDATFWLINFTWDYLSSEKAIRAGNLEVLQNFLESNAVFLTSVQKSNLYSLLEKEIENAAKAKCIEGKDKKIIQRDVWKNELLIKARNLEAGISSTLSNDLLVSKMEVAGIDNSSILSAIDLRFSYSWANRNSPYLDPQGVKLRKAARQILAEMNALRNKLEAGILNQDGVAFHQTCIERLEALRNAMKDEFGVDFAFLQGCMYDITGRCQHHFVRSSK